MCKEKQEANETYHHEGWCQENPTDEPVIINPVSDHVLDAYVEPAHRRLNSTPLFENLLFGSKDPADGDSLEENTPNKREATGRVEIHQLEDVDPSLKD